MTGLNPERSPRRRSVIHRGPGRSTARKVRSEVGEKLREAREIRGVDLFRVERDTKIRSKYLAALEDGEFAELPGDVYARGFLRNYATYLGLDADEMEEEWRDEAGQAQPLTPTIVGPQPMTVRRRVVLQQSHVVAGIVAVIVLVVAAYFGFQLTRYLSYPTLAVASAGPSPIVVQMGATTYVLKGTATAGATILISYNGQNPTIVVADDAGNWTFTAPLSSGSNQFDITAKNLDTSHASQTTRVVIIVPTPTPTPVEPQVAFETPADGAAVPSGNVTVTGTTILVSSVTLTMTYLGAPLAAGSTLAPASPTPAIPSPSASDAAASASPGPAPVEAKTGADGSFTMTVPMAPGRWKLTLVGSTAGGGVTKGVSRALNVTYKGINVTVQVRGKDATIHVNHDDTVDANALVPDGWSINVVGSKLVCVSSKYQAASVFISINGAPFVPISTYGGWHAYIDANGPRNVSTC